MVSDELFDASHPHLSNEFESSAVNVRPVELCYYCSEEVWMSVEQILYWSLSLRDNERIDMNELVLRICALGFNQGSRVSIVAWSAECNHSE